MSLESTEMQDLVNVILDSFRVRKNSEPVYLDIGGDNFRRLTSKQHQIIFGRRGSGKSCLFVYCLNESKKTKDQKFIYVGMDQFKTLKFPDILTSLLIEILSNFESARKKWYWPFKSPITKLIDELENILNQALDQDIEQGEKSGSKGKSGIKPKTMPLNIEIEQSLETSLKSKFAKSKQETLERNLSRYKRIINLATPDHSSVFLLIDDYYLVNKQLQPDVIDYLHRLFRDTNVYLKFGTIRHRTTLRRFENQTIGIELGQDFEEINLDRTLSSLSSTKDYLVAIIDELGRNAGIDSVSNELFNVEAAHALTLASGGVPRDFLNTFVEAVNLSIAAGKTDRLTPTYIYQAAAQHAIRNKTRNLSEDAGVLDTPALENAFADIINFCLQEKKRTVFLISHDDARKFSQENEMIHQLMDFKLIHLIESDTSAASGRTGRFSAYTLDAALFMYPRRRKIEIVKFWEQDGNHRPVGVRESPTYSLSRITNNTKTSLADALENVNSIPEETA